MKMMTDGNLDGLDHKNIEDDKPKSDEESVVVNSNKSTARQSEDDECYLKEMDPIKE